MQSENTAKRILEFASHLDGIDVEILRQGLEISRLHRQIEQRFEHDWAQWGLSAVQVRILMSLFHNDEGTMTPALLSEEAILTRSAMTGALDSLEKLGHLERRRHAEDRRKVAVCLTPSGRAFLREHLPSLYRKIHRLMSHLTQQERAFFQRAYRKMLDLLVSDLLEDRK